MGHRKESLGITSLVERRKLTDNAFFIYMVYFCGTESLDTRESSVSCPPTAESRGLTLMATASSCAMVTS